MEGVVYLSYARSKTVRPARGRRAQTGYRDRARGQGLTHS